MQDKLGLCTAVISLPLPHPPLSYWEYVFFAQDKGLHCKSWCLCKNKLIINSTIVVVQSCASIVRSLWMTQRTTHREFIFDSAKSWINRYSRINVSERSNHYRSIPTHSKCGPKYHRLKSIQSSSLSHCRGDAAFENRQSRATIYQSNAESNCTQHSPDHVLIDKGDHKKGAKARSSGH